MIRVCNHADFTEIWVIINDGASAYKGMIVLASCAQPEYLFLENIALKLVLEHRSVAELGETAGPSS